MAIKKFSLHKFDGGMSDDQRVQSLRQYFDNDGFDILNENYALKPLRDWFFRVDYDDESVINDTATSLDAPVINYNNDFVYTMTEDGSGNAIPVQISGSGAAGLLDGTLSISDPSTSTSGTAAGFDDSSLFYFERRLYFVDSNGDIGYYDTTDNTIYYAQHSPTNSDYNNVPPILSPDRKTILFAYNNEVHEVAYDPSADTFTFSEAVLIVPDEITSMDVKGTRVMVATYEEENGSYIHPWNPLEEDIDTSYYVSEDPVAAMGQVSNKYVAITSRESSDDTYATYDGYVEFHFLTGSRFERYRRLPDTSDADARTNSFRNVRKVEVNNKLYFATRQNVFVVGSKNSDSPVVVSRLTSFKQDASKTSYLYYQEDKEIHSIFSVGSSIGVVGDFQFEELDGEGGSTTGNVENNKGIFLMDADPDNYIQADFVTQKYRFDDIDSTSQLVMSSVAIDGSTPTDESADIEITAYRDGSEEGKVIDPSLYDGTTRIYKSKRIIDTNENPGIGNEWHFNIRSGDGGAVAEFNFSLAPRRQKYNN